ncbi:MAG: ribonuclease P protein component [Bacteroidales bacterium]|nr:ribonuclease P protein component [Bacteroidales bacterium]
MSALPKHERLYEQRLISCLFSEGKHLSPSPRLRVRFLLIERSGDEVEDFAPLPPVKLMVSASKRNFKHAVTRNRVKRLLREVYRFHKEEISGLVPAQKTLLLFLQYAGKEEVSLEEMKTLVQQFIEVFQKRLRRE